MLELTIAIQFPANARSSHAKVMRDFTARMDYLSFHVRDLSKSIHFEDFSLSSRFGSVIVEASIPLFAMRHTHILGHRMFMHAISRYSRVAARSKGLSMDPQSASRTKTDRHISI
jgi:hypothetical protein